MFGTKTTVTAKEVTTAINSLRELEREIESELKNVLTVCQNARKVDADIFRSTQSLSRANDTAEMLKISDDIARLVAQRTSMDAKINSLAGTGGEMARRINAVCDETLAGLDASLRKVAAMAAIQA